MPRSEGPSRQEIIGQALREAGQPLTFDELLAAVQRLTPIDAKKLKATLSGNNMSQSPLVQRTADGRYVWLLSLLPGVTIRHTFSEAELQSRQLMSELMLAAALWPEVPWLHIQPHSPPWTARLPHGPTVTIQPAKGEKHGVEWLAVDPAFWTWLERAHAQPGDSLFLTVIHADRRECHLTLEPAAECDADRLAGRNQAVADAVCRLLQGRRRQVFLRELAPSLLALGVYHDPYPPDPLQTILEADERFLWNMSSAIELATRYDQLYRALGLGPISAGIGAWLARLEASMEAELIPADAEEPSRELRRPVAEMANEVYRFKAAFRYRPGLWRRIEIRGDQDLYDFDGIMRDAFGHDCDHLSEFYLGADADHYRRGLGNMTAFGDLEYDEAVDFCIGELGLRPGDKLSYTYDFGDNIQHVLELEAITPAEPDRDYPRVVEKNRPRYLYCDRCRARGKQQIATGCCIDCSHSEQRQVLLCEDCIPAAHAEHYIEDIVY